MKKIPILILIMTCLLAIGVSGMIITIDQPASSSVVSGTSYFAWTITGTEANLSLSNCTLAAYSASTANTSATSWISINDTNATVYNNSFNTAGLEDNNAYTVVVNCTDGTNDYTNSSNATTITINNTVPTAPTIADQTDTSPSSIDFTSTVTGGSTTACTLEFRNAEYTMTHSGNTCTYTLSDATNVVDGGFEYYVIASDGTDTNRSDRAVIFTDVIGGGVPSLQSSGVSGATIVNKVKPLLTKQVWKFPVWAYIAVFLLLGGFGGIKKWF